MTLWDDASALLNGGVDAAFGEAVDLYRPATGGGYAVSSPPVLVGLGVTAIIDESPEIIGAEGEGGSRERASLQLAAGQVLVSFERARFASEADLPKKGDIVHRASGARLELVVVSKDDGDRMNAAAVRRA